MEAHRTDDESIEADPKELVKEGSREVLRNGKLKKKLDESYEAICKSERGRLYNFSQGVTKAESVQKFDEKRKYEMRPYKRLASTSVGSIRLKNYLGKRKVLEKGKGGEKLPDAGLTDREEEVCEELHWGGKGEGG